MVVKCIVVDMDGTFLSKGNDYNRERFAPIFQELKQRGIAFVVASGNQYYQISSFFDDEQIIYAAENGAWISQNGKDLDISFMNFKDALNIFQVLEQFEHVDACICGKKSAYVLEERLIPRMSMCFPVVKVIEHVDEIDDQLFKIALETPMDQTEKIKEAIMKVLPKQMEAVNSGFGCIDINQKGVDKGSALLKICDYLHITPDEVMAFGDSGNDVGMLKLAKYSYAMQNAQPQIKELASYSAPACEDEGVLQVLEAFLQDSE